ncbi:endospore germination permease [Clostridium sp. CX1]|uniref:GerAB/ArcD/ProY family transporter n=1 Tax=Clostridium sp. CX1 TaxID=2978346 RepID=UPI0021C0A57B|nr:endospore germination permease [Clostridium sp. CX1]MCT8976560.1 endospore germination permease [Clostridium sp. CX1]
MLESGSISEHQIKVLVMLNFIGTAVINAPGALMMEAKQEVWIVGIIGLIIGLALMKLYTALGMMFKGMTIVQYSRKLLGKIFGTLISFWFILFLILNTSAFLWIEGDFISTQIITETPQLATNILFMTVVIFASRLGIEVLARTAEVLYPWAVGGIVILTILVSPSIEVRNLMPILEVGIKPIARGALFYQSFISLTFVAFLMIFPAFVNNVENAKKSFFTGMILAGLLFETIILATVLVMGANVASRNLYSTYALAKMISIGEFVERIEAIIAMVWVISIFFNTVLYFYGALIALAQLLDLKDYKALTIPLGIIVIILTEIRFPNSAYALQWNTTTWVAYALTNGLVIPLLLLVVGKIKGKKT